MPSRKQRRRREKSLRHEYIWVDEDGREFAVVAGDPEEKAEKRAAKTEAKQKAQPKAAQRGRGPGREVPPPSWRRVGKRALVFAPLMFVAVTVLDPKYSYGQRAAETAFLLAFFLPFSYVMDTVAYRLFLRRTGRTPEPRKKSESADASRQPSTRLPR